jgi:iron complex transport system substrate-binding protein
VQFGRGPATVFGFIAESQATLPCRRGWAYFARGYASSRTPGFSPGFLFSDFSRHLRQGRFVQHCSANTMRRARVFSSILLLLSALPLRAQSVTSAPSSTTASPAMRDVVDEFGRTIRVPQLPTRIVSLAPSLTETLYALGVQDRLVGDTDYCDYPPDAQKKTKVGGPINPNIEEIAALHPDLVLVTKEINRLDTVRALDTLGIPTYATDARNVDEILSTTQKLADLLGVPETGKSLVADLQSRLAALHARLEAIPPSRVLFIVWTEPLISVGKNTFIADALRKADAASIVESTQDWPQMSLEEVVRLRPEYLVFAESHSDAASREFEVLANRPGWDILEAVRNHHFAVVSDAVNRPAPRIVSAIEDLARQLHPAAFQEAPAPEKPATPAPMPSNPAAAAPAHMTVNTPSFTVEFACAR